MRTLKDQLHNAKLRNMNQDLTEKLIESRNEVIELNKRIMDLCEEYEKIYEVLKRIEKLVQVRDETDLVRYRELIAAIQRRSKIGGF
jgi:predicted nuclease with TOPRIM domain